MYVSENSFSIFCNPKFVLNLKKIFNIEFFIRNTIFLNLSVYLISINKVDNLELDQNYFIRTGFSFSKLNMRARKPSSSSTA